MQIIESSLIEKKVQEWLEEMKSIFYSNNYSDWYKVVIWSHNKLSLHMSTWFFWKRKRK